MLTGFFNFAVAAKCINRFVVAVCLPMLVACSITAASNEPRTQSVASTVTDVADTEGVQVFTGNLKVLTLNMAHGRKDGFNQLFQSKERIHNNLTEIAALLKQSGADIVALQEADGPSRWSGNFDHVSLLAQQADYSWYSRTGHAQSWLFDYGTALLARGEFAEMLSHAFLPSPPTLNKGFLLGQIAWRPNEFDDPPLMVDVISVHLDFSRRSVRQQQIAEMTAILANRTNPMIILGDFNSDWLSDESVVTDLARRCGLHSYRPLANNLGTYRKSGRRLDWILISDDLEFKHYSVLPKIVSDHYAVVAEVAFRNKQTTNWNDNKTHLACK